MHGSTADLPMSLEVPEGKMWQADWGGTTV
jgi:hypothetical protein